MSGTRTLAVLVSVALLIAGCTDGNGGDTTTTSVPDQPATTEGATTTSEGSPSTSVPVELDLSPFEAKSADWRCSYVSDYVAVSVPYSNTTESEPFGHVSEITDFLDDGGIGASVAVATDVLEATSEGSAATIGPLIDQFMGFIHLVDGDDPLTVSLLLQDQGVAASPIHAMGLSAHWAFKPATDPVPTADVLASGALTLPQVPDPTGGVIGVVDSGVATGLPRWMRRSLEGDSGPLIYEDRDIEQLSDTNLASHGAFVASLLRQLAPSHRVSIVKAHEVPHGILTHRPFDDEELPTSPNSTTQPYVTTELHVASALMTLIQRGHSQSEMTSLNLSLGTYTCDPSGDALLVTLVEVLDHWWFNYPDTPVFASAGNENMFDDGETDQYGDPVSIPFWPAALRVYPPQTGSVAWDFSDGIDGNPLPEDALNFSQRVFGVGALEEKSNRPVVWDESGLDDPASDRDWTIMDAPGSNIIGQGNAQTYVWSGSSFASAIAAAMHAIGQGPDYTYQTVGGLAYLPPSP